MAGCASKTTSSPLPGAADPCLLATAPGHPPDTFTVALADSVGSAHAGHPANDSERLLLRHLYPGLIRLDCRGEVRPDLAAEWSTDSARNGWTFLLRDGARWADGSPVTAAGLLASWQSRWPKVRDLGVDSASALDERRLSVRLRDSPDASLQVFADPILSALPHQVGGSRQLQFVPSVRGDLRDELEAGADLVVTRDPAVIDYAAQRPEFETFPLPWDRTYALVQPAGALLLGGLDDESIRRSLAQDAVRGDARPTPSPFWWNNPCSVITKMEATIPTTPRVDYLQDDPVARQLAERIVALAPEALGLTSRGLDSAGFAAARLQRAARAYVLSFPARPISPCREAGRLTRGQSITALVDTRARAIVRRGSPPLTVDWDGVPRLP